ncbi:hypothetical protein BKA65DRAFT_481105 [Rhexocercosporidium sp. MPI-PUGE-AT-0058]|nr:hypothetical protein BKA65DRAFT_481105 [Rhexocercosporidium sp. MPI-PUGE-AT-0058]
MATTNLLERDPAVEGNVEFGTAINLPGLAWSIELHAGEKFVRLQGPSGHAGQTYIKIELERFDPHGEQDRPTPGVQQMFKVPIPRWWIDSELNRMSAGTPDAGDGDSSSPAKPQTPSSMSARSLTPSSATITRQFELSGAETSFISPWKYPPRKYLDFMKFPPEIRNMIYGLLLCVDKPVMIASPAFGKGSYRGIKKHLTSLIAVSKQIGDEARTTFCGSNTWVVGNGFWGSREQPNRHALKVFLARVPRHTTALIRRLQIDIHFPCTAVKYFRSVEKILVLSDGGLGPSITVETPLLKTGPVKAMTKLFELPSLKTICFLNNKDETSFQNVADGMLAGKSGERAKEKNIVVTVAEGVRIGGSRRVVAGSSLKRTTLPAARSSDTILSSRRSNPSTLVSMSVNCFNFASFMSMRIEVARPETVAVLLKSLRAWIELPQGPKQTVKDLTFGMCLVMCWHISRRCEA